MLRIKQRELFAVIYVALRKACCVRIFSLKINRQIAHQFVTPPLLGMHLYNIPSQFPVETKHLAINVHCRFYLTLSESLTESFNPMPIVIVHYSNCLAHNSCKIFL